MTTSWKPTHESKRYERAGSIALNQVKLGQAPISLARVRWQRRGIWLLAILVVAMGGLALWLTFDARFYVYDARISGTRRLSNEQVFQASGLDGLHILWARPQTIESRVLEALPSLEEAEVSCEFPSDCTIRVVERRPQVLWDSDGELWCIDEEGAIFAAADAAGEGSLESEAAGWRISGPVPRDEDGCLDERVRAALGELWKSGMELPSVFEYDPIQGLSFVDGHGWRIIVGQGRGMGERVAVLEPLLEHLEERGIEPSFVDVRFPNAPYYAPPVD